MDLRIKDQLFIVCGASSGFGRAIAQNLHQEGARLIINARNKRKLSELAAELGERVETLAGDITQESTLAELIKLLGERTPQGLVVNAGGPPAMKVEESRIADWDDAYRSLLRWKVMITQALLGRMKEAGYGRMLYVESISVKQPVENLVLSNSLRMAVVGMVKTLSNEVANAGVTLNVMAPGYHATAAIDRLVAKKQEQSGMNADEILAGYTSSIPVGFMGSTADFASLACWLLSPHSRYITGQTISVDGGRVAGSMG
jgi:3-oxoacyl-[acyl-carrier protein] reductase